MPKNDSPIKIHRNPSFTEYYYNLPDTTGKREMSFFGRKTYPYNWDVNRSINKQIEAQMKGHKWLNKKGMNESYFDTIEFKRSRFSDGYSGIVEVFKNPTTSELRDIAKQSYDNGVRFGIDKKGDIYAWMEDILHHQMGEKLNKEWILRLQYTFPDDTLWLSSDETIKNWNARGKPFIPKLQKMIPNLKKIEMESKPYKVVHIYENHILDATLKGAERLGVKVDVLDGEPYLMLHHGTSKGNLNKIIKSGKFKVNTYFAPDQETARKYAGMTGSNPVTTIAIVKADGLMFDGHYFYAKRDLEFMNGRYS